jgi:hypothetical protein
VTVKDPGDDEDKPPALGIDLTGAHEIVEITKSKLLKSARKIYLLDITHRPIDELGPESTTSPTTPLEPPLKSVDQD